MPPVNLPLDEPRVSSRRISPWAAGVVGVAAIGAIYGATTSAYVQVMRRVSPDAVLKFEPGDPSALNRRNTALVSKNGMSDPKKRAIIGRNALRSARGEFLNPQAVGNLALIKTIDVDRETAFRYFAVASQLSRRDQFTELWLGSYYLDKRKVSLALGHFDRLLRVTPATAQVINPILTRTLADRANVAAFRPFFAKPPLWFADFLRHAMQNEKALPVLADILAAKGTKLPDKPVYRAVESETLGWLVERGDFVRAKRLLAAQGADMVAVANSAAFSPKSRDSAAGPFAWRIGMTEGLSGAFESYGAKSGDVHFRASVSSLARGVALEKTLTLQPGTYRLGFAYEVTDHGREATALWRGFCLGGAQLFSAPIDVERRKGVASAVITVPADCEAQQLQLLIAGGEVFPGLDLLIAPPSVKKGAPGSP